MRTMTWSEIDKDWEGVDRQCKAFEKQAKANALARYCVGHSLSEVIKRIGISKTTAWHYLGLVGAQAAIGGGPDSGPPLKSGETGSGSYGQNDIHRDLERVVRDYGPTEDDAEEFAPYLEHHELEYGEGSPVAARIARAEFATENAVEAGVIKEATNKKNEKVNQILFPEDAKDTFELDLRMHMARVKSAANFLDKAKVRNLRLKSTCEKVAAADELWRVQAELVLAHYQPS